MPASQKLAAQLALLTDLLVVRGLKGPQSWIPPLLCEGLSPGQGEHIAGEQYVCVQK